MFLKSLRSKLLRDESEAVFMIKLLLLRGNKFTICKTYLITHVQLERGRHFRARTLIMTKRNSACSCYLRKANFMHLPDIYEFLKETRKLIWFMNLTPLLFTLFYIKHFLMLPNFPFYPSSFCKRETIMLEMFISGIWLETTKRESNAKRMSNSLDKFNHYLKPGTIIIVSSTVLLPFHFPSFVGS